MLNKVQAIQYKISNQQTTKQDQKKPSPKKPVQKPIEPVVAEPTPQATKKADVCLLDFDFEPQQPSNPVINQNQPPAQGHQQVIKPPVQPIVHH